MSNVTQLKPTTEPSIPELTAIAHRSGAAKAVHCVHGLLAAEHKRLSSDDGDAVKTATYAYELKLDDQTLRAKAEQDKASRAVLLAVNKLHWSITDGKEVRDVLATKADDAKKARKSRLLSFEAASNELLQQKQDTNQSSFGFAEDDDDAGILSATSKATTSVVYAALMHMQDTNIALGPYQVEVIQALGTEGVETMDLGLDAADAVEHDEDEEEASEVDDEDAPF